VRDRPNSIALCSSLAGRTPARELVPDLNSVMEFGFYTTVSHTHDLAFRSVDAFIRHVQ